MPSKFQDRYRIPSTRLQNWDYGWNAIYFITICASDREHCFGKVSNKTMELSEIGLLAHQFWCEIPDHFPFICLDAFVIMPNHIHGVLIIDKDNDGHFGPKTVSDSGSGTPPSSIKPLTISSDISKTNAKSSNIHADITLGHKRFQNQGSNTISSIIGSYKSIVSKKAHPIYKDFGWQAGFYDHIVHSDREFDRIRQYIDDNPANWTNDKYFA